MTKKFISIDTETGGLGLDKSLLTIGLVLADESLTEIDARQFYVKPDDGVYKITADGLKVNGINLVEHNQYAKTERETGKLLYEVLDLWSLSGRDKLIPLGKQVAGDILQIQKVISRGSWEHFVSYRVLEISSVSHTLISLGLIPESNDSLADLIKQYNIPNLGLHDALADARMTLAVYRAMRSHLRGMLRP